MPLTIEDGSLVSNADSYVTRAEYIAYALSLGVVIADDSTADVQLVKAANYIGQHEDNLKGNLVARAQSMAYPRYDLVIDGWSWSGSEIPDKVKDCQIAFAMDINAGEDLWNRSANPNLVTKSERVEGAVSVEYAIGGNQEQKLIKKSQGDSLLDSLLSSAFSMSIELERR